MLRKAPAVHHQRPVRHSLEEHHLRLPKPGDQFIGEAAALIVSSVGRDRLSLELGKLLTMGRQDDADALDEFVITQRNQLILVFDHEQIKNAEKGRVKSDVSAGAKYANKQLTLVKVFDGRSKTTHVPPSAHLDTAIEGYSPTVVGKLGLDYMTKMVDAAKAVG
jgi:hypothetical protein